MSPSTDSMSCLDTDLISLKLGPYHPSLPGTMIINLKLDGELITQADIETGFLHKGLEKVFELHTWQSSISYADRLDPEGAAFAELALCLAVEEIGEIPVPARAQMIRIMFNELARISCHMSYLVKVARACGSETLFHFVARDREKVLDLFELLTGVRFAHNYLRFGGVALDVTEGFLERVLEVSDLVRVRMKEYNDVLTYNKIFLNRSSGVGVISQAIVDASGMSGPNARASGLHRDLRKQAPYSSYTAVDFEVPVGRSEGGNLGDAHDRFVLRLREIDQSISILKQVVEQLPSGDYLCQRVTRDFILPAGEAYSRVESSRGILGCYIVSEGGTHPCRVHFRVPSISQLIAIPFVAQGLRIEDLPLVLASLDISVTEVDR